MRPTFSLLLHSKPLHSLQAHFLKSSWLSCLGRRSHCGMPEGVESVLFTCSRLSFPPLAPRSQDSWGKNLISRNREWGTRKMLHSYGCQKNLFLISPEPWYFKGPYINHCLSALVSPLLQYGNINIACLIGLWFIADASPFWTLEIYTST